MTPEAISGAWPQASFTVIATPGLGSARDQGPRGTCLAMATTAAHVGAQQTTHWLSEEYLFHSARQYDSLLPGDEGTTVDGILRALASPGQPDEAQWPYDRARVTPPRPAPLLPTCAGPFFAWNATRIGATVDALDAALTARHPVVVVLQLTFGFSRPSGGIVRLLAADPAKAALHAVLIVGQATMSSGGQGFFLVRNSWGGNWGVSGYALVEKQYLNLRLRSAFVLSQP